MEATTPELSPVGFWSPKSSSFSGSDSIVVEEAARNFQSPRPSTVEPHLSEPHLSGCSDYPTFYIKEFLVCIK